MKLLKIFGIVAGLHAFALLLIFANPGCSSSRSATPPETPPAAKPEPGPTISAVTPVPAPPESPAPAQTLVPAEPAAPSAEAAPAGGAFYSPTRPGTPAATALETQQAPADLTPAAAYTVGRGDSLWSIAKKNHLRVSVLAAANHVRVGTTLRPGQKLVIPGKPAESKASAAAPAASPAPARAAATAPAAPAGESVKHVVQRGETLGTIAQHYHVRVGAIATANSISDPQKIRPGQELIIPAPGRSSGGRNGSASAKGSAGSSSASPAIPAPNQDLDAGLKTPPPSQVPVIRIDPDAPASASAPAPSPAAKP